jgi:hypothetical protein
LEKWGNLLPRRKPVAELNRSELLREIQRLVKSEGQRGAARRLKMPISTLRDWIKTKRRIPKKAKSVKRARKLVKKIRQLPKRPPKKIKRRRRAPVSDHDASVAAIHWAMASGPGVVPLSASRVDRLAARVAKGKHIATGGITTDQLETVRRRALAAFEAGGNTAENAGDAFKRQFTHDSDGHQMLSDAFIVEFQWLMDERASGTPVIPREELDVTVDERNNASTTTDSNANIWSLFRHCEDLPPGYFVVVYEPIKEVFYKLTLCEIVDAGKHMVGSSE